MASGEIRLKLAHALLVAVLTLQPGAPVQADPLLTYALRIKGHPLRAELANDDETRRTGLMFRERMPDNSGMLFVYEAEERHAMWMKNTLIGLSVAFIDKRGRIINIEDMEPQTEEAHAARAPAAFALEVNRGWFKKRGIRIGDRIEGLEKIPKSKD
jgi:uncharacterized membrane protein (UPF0127 family)